MPPDTIDSNLVIYSLNLVKELSTIPRDPAKLQEYACENDCSTVVLCGNQNYVGGLKNQIENSPSTKYNRKINVRIEEVKG